MTCTPCPTSRQTLWGGREVKASLVLVALAAGLWTVPLGAQKGAQNGALASKAARYEIAIGVSLDQPKDVNQRPQCVALGLPCGSPKTFPDGGLLFQAAVYLRPRFAIATEGSIYRNLWDTVGVATDLTNRVTAVLVGPRVIVAERTIGGKKDSERIRVSTQLLGGVERSSILPARAAIQPGANVDVALGIAPLWVRVGYDYRYTHGGPRNLSQNRVALGLVGVR